MFMNSVNKSKFQVAATRLQKLGFGSLVALRQLALSSLVFVKKLPAEVAGLLQTKECRDLCTLDEYQSRFDKPSSAAIKKSVQDVLIQENWVHPDCFKKKESKALFEESGNDFLDS